MSFPPGTFYVYMEHNGNQYLVAFPSRSAADELWRTIQTTNYMEGQTHRHTPQYWSVALLPREIHSGSASGSSSCFVQRIPSGGGLESGRLLIAFPHHSPDNVNGKCFFIRSAIRPNIYWYLNRTSDRIELSSTQQTRFLIKRRVPLPFDYPPEEDILIGTDDIHIYAFPDDDKTRHDEHKKIVVKYRHTKKNLAVSVPSAANEEEATFQFGMFEGGFGGHYSADQAHGRAGFAYVPSRPDDGERWEFTS
ncbi:hypothetical protein D9756_003625 [Leucocoprinus leucothites]|uniref:Uncharacterized protein n=1 Tax=Leucocoprinus leucothites TaxID=201217 RepID=A0A8H5G6V1_9AGAR|nr:hypothetical protein D9756_003625 [Leucoagaricus leucothites]